ncbi:MAG: TauD/TfdA dioxygenase family protein [Gammaproteobacteria bacterium]
MFEQRALGANFGLEILGLDVRRDCEGDAFTRLPELLYAHRVLLIRGQSLAKAEFAAFGRRWGAPIRFYLASSLDPDQPELIRVDNRPDMPEARREAAAHWHTDSSYEPQPACVTMLYGVEAPDSGGETLFADMAAAYDALPAAMRERIDGLQVRHLLFGGERMASESSRRGADLDEVRRKKLDDSPVHPLVLRHPVTGRRALYAVAGSAVGIVGLADDDGLALLRELKLHALQSRFVLSVKASAGDILIWDDLSTLHSATPVPYTDEAGQRRLLLRYSTRDMPPEFAVASPFASPA